MASRKQLAAMAFAVLFLLVLVAPRNVDATAPGRPHLPGDSAWDNRFGGPPGLDGVVEALAINSKTGEVYVGGRFRWAGSTAVSDIAKWDPSTKQWSALGAGILGGFSDVRAIAVTSSGTVYAGGSFGKWDGNVADFLIKWNGKTWSGVGAGVNAAVEALTASGSAVYAGGNFTTAGGLKVNGIARWNESTKSWSALSSGVFGHRQCNRCEWFAGVRRRRL